MRRGIIAPTAIIEVTTRNYILPILIFLYAGLIPAIFALRAEAQVAEFEMPEGGVLTVQGEDFVFEQISVVQGEEIVLQDRAAWHGGVTASYSDETGQFALETEHVEAIFDGPNVTRLEAGPQVVMTGYGGRARFECTNVHIDFPTADGEANEYRGICTDVAGYYLADSYQLGLEGNRQYQVNFTASVARLSPGEAVLESPTISLGDLEDPDLAISSEDIRFIIGPDPETGDRIVLGARAENVTLSVFGIKFEVIPFPVWRGFVSRDEPGWEISLPGIGWEGDEYLRIDQRIAYNFEMGSFDQGPRLVFRINSFPFDRTYPEVMADCGWEDVYADVRVGYRREEDRNGDPVPVRAEPEITVGMNPVNLGDTGLSFRASTFWGHLRDMQSGPDLDRWGYGASLVQKDIPLDGFSLGTRVDFEDIYYRDGNNYSTLDGRVHLRYVDPPRWGATLTYSRIYDWGLTPFRFDLPRAREELGLRQQTRFSERWGAGFDWAWDFNDDEFERQECHLTYIFDSFQVSVGWDFTDDEVMAEVALPGSLK
jgi:hypothetical protein